MKPATYVSTKKLNLCQQIESKWDDAIISAEEEIETLTKQAKRLKLAVRVFKANKRDGVPWPEEQQKSPQEEG